MTENPKRGIAKNFGRIWRGTTQICLETEHMGGGGFAEVIKSYEGDRFSEVKFKGGIG